MATQKKIDTVNELQDKIGKAKAFIFTEYAGLKHKQLEELRKALAKTNGEFVVTKNKLMERALGGKSANVKEYLKESTATLFCYADEVAPLKDILKFFKASGMGKTKGGMLGDTVMNASEVDRLSQLPNKNVLLGKLVGQLNAPIQGLHYALSWNMNKLVWALNAVKSKKTS